MTTERALDLAFENPNTCITTEEAYDQNGFFVYYDHNGNLRNQEGNVIQESDIWKRIPESEDEEFDEWREIDATIPEDDGIISLYDDYDEYWD